jgi:hypothetical protein
MDELRFGGDKVKNIAAWGIEKVGRLKLNGQLTGYSPLSRVVELEGLLAGIAGKRGSGSRCSRWPPASPASTPPCWSGSATARRSSARPWRNCARAQRAKPSQGEGVRPLESPTLKGSDPLDA